jgi:exosortase/archaeosortase family protein
MNRQRKKGRPKAPRRSWKLLWQSWSESKAPLFQFCWKFCVLIVLLYGLSLTPVGQRILAASAIGNVWLASAILDRLGENTRVTEATFQSAKYAITVLPTCSASEFLLFYCATVIAFPARVSRKVSGILIGIVALLALNQLRILSLYYVGSYFPRFFDTIHEDLWSMLLIIAVVVLCVTWIGWARENDRLDRNGVA